MKSGLMYVMSNEAAAEQAAGRLLKLLELTEPQLVRAAGSFSHSALNICGDL